MTESDHFDDINDLENFAAAMAVGTRGTPLAAIAETCTDLLNKLRVVHPVKAAAAFGAFLTQKRLQSNCLRLEVLVHFALISGGGPCAPTAKLLTQGYAAAGESCSYLEEPPEDIFVGNIYSTRGNYRVLEGLWESGTFYLQRLVNLIDSFPDTVEFNYIGNSIHALLKISDIVCERAGLQRNDLGDLIGEGVLPIELANNSGELCKLVQFSFEELQKYDLNEDDFSPFIFDLDKRDDLLNQAITNSALEARPLVVLNDQLYVLLPSAVSAAIRRFFIEALGTGENRQPFLFNLGREYTRLFDQTPMLGKTSREFPFAHRAWGSVCCSSQKVDEGRFLNIVFFLDTMEEFDVDGLAGFYVGNERLDEELKKATCSMQDAASKQPGFRGGITLLVGCGIGRGAAFPAPVEARENWEVEFLSAPDYCTLSRVSEMNPLNLWRITEMRTRIEDMGVRLQNMNGFLNLYAWAASLKGHLVPHADVPDAVDGQKVLHISIVQNSLVELRHGVAKAVDQHVEPFVDGKWLQLQTEGKSHFDEDDLQPLYGHMPSDKNRRPMGASITSSRCWWYDLASPVDGPDTTSYDRWKILGTWIVRAVEPLEQSFVDKLGAGPILWRCVFEQPQNKDEIEIPGTEQEANAAIKLTTDALHRTVELSIGVGFDKAIFHPENIAERALVTAFVRGVAKLAGNMDYHADDLVNRIVPNSQARHSHIFTARNFRDYLHTKLSGEPIAISQFDDAAAKLGLGWSARSPDEGGRIEGKEACLTFLNGLVRQLEKDLCQELHRFDRAALLSKLLFNHELASASRERWHRTAAAALALRSDKMAALKSMKVHEFKLNAIFQPSRNLVEMVICESPISQGLLPGELDLSRLLTLAAQLFHLGGWSDLIRWDLLDPSLVVTPLGDVHVNHDFIDTVMDSFGNTASEYRYMASVRNYARNFKNWPVFAESKERIEEKFLSAWNSEFGIAIDGYRRFIDAVENYAIERNMPVVQLKRSKLVALAETPGDGSLIVDSLTLAPRISWRELPEGYDNKDIAPWRFRRRLSSLRRPLLQINVEEDPEIVVAPGLLREGFAYMVGNYYEGAYPDWHLGPAMKKYAGYARNRDGMQFNQDVVDRMLELGWKAELEVNITKIVRKTLARNHGDVDVLAWDVKQGRVLIMECKDLQFRKTYGEIAEQLSDFRGEVSSDGKRRDLLRKHLDRVEVLRAHDSELKKYLELNTDCLIESVIVFRHPVPMQFAEGAIRDDVDLYTFDRLQDLNR